MKKVININFQGRVIPIEETAYDMLKQYVESLRLFFANEEGKDEIINDIEGRIAELFAENLKKGSTCITDDDVNNIIKSMGRPEDFETEEPTVHSQLSGDESNEQKSDWQKTTIRGRLYRSEDDKFIGGVCAGIANYLRVDPTIVRILFAIITFGGFGFGFVLYIILWILLPSKTLETNLKKRLFRNPDDRIIGGVAGGLAAYFDIKVWIPRLIFALPLIAGIISSIFGNIFLDGDTFPSILFGSFGSTLTIVYVVLWMVIPEATTPTEKLEMRGEKIDLNSIKNTFKEEFEGIKSRAEKVGSDIKDKAQKWGGEVAEVANEKSKAFAREAAPVAKRSRNGIGRAIGILFKAFFLFLFGVIAFAALMGMLGVLIGGVSIFPLKDYFIEGFTQNLLAWCTLILFVGIPVIAFITWIIRRVVGAKSNSYLSVAFIILWVVGLFCGIMLAVSIANDFTAYAREKQEYNIEQPSNDKMVVKVQPSNVRVKGRWFKLEGVVRYSDDSIFLNNVKLRIVKSKDSLFHSFATKASYAGTDVQAMNYAQSINYNISQNDSVLMLPHGFALNKGTRFRNQGVIVTLQVPVGKRILVDKSVSRKLDWFGFNHGHSDFDDEDEWDDYERYSYGVEYIMTEGGLERIEKSEKKKKRKDTEMDAEELQREIEKGERELERKRNELNRKIDSNITQQTVEHTENDNSEGNFNTIQSSLIFRSII